MEVTVYGQLRGATDGKTVVVAFDGGTVAGALAAFVEAYPRAERHLYEDGALAPAIRVTVDGERVEPGDNCPADATMSVHPAMQGG